MTTLPDIVGELRIEPIPAKLATELVVKNHYLHRKSPVSYAFGIYRGTQLMGVVTFGTPASRHLQKSASPTNPGLVLELNRLWVDDCLPANTESWFVSRAMKLLPPRIVVSYADPVVGHYGYIYRALNFHYAGWTDMDRNTPRWDYIPLDPTRHSREATRSGHSHKMRRTHKVRYWTVTGNKAERKALEAVAGWPKLSWKEQPPPEYKPKEVK